MEVKIKQGEEMIDATIEMVDGVMVVSPKVNQDVSQFKDGDVITICHNEGYKTTTIFSEFYKRGFNAHATLYPDGKIGICCGSLSFGELNRFATEEEKQELFKALEDNGLSWDAEKRELVEMKWKPTDRERYYCPNGSLVCYKFDIGCTYWGNDIVDKFRYEKGWLFPYTEQGRADCQKLVDKLNEAINSVKL